MAETDRLKAACVNQECWEWSWIACGWKSVRICSNLDATLVLYLCHMEQNASQNGRVSKWRSPPKGTMLNLNWSLYQYQTEDWQCTFGIFKFPALPFTCSMYVASLLLMYVNFPTNPPICPFFVVKVARLTLWVNLCCFWQSTVEHRNMDLATFTHRNV